MHETDAVGVRQRGNAGKSDAVGVRAQTGGGFCALRAEGCGIGSDFCGKKRERDRAETRRSGRMECKKLA